MKKFVIFALIAAMTAGVAFAQDVTVGGWGRAVFLPLKAYDAEKSAGKAVDDKDGYSVAGSQVSWGGAPRVGIAVNGNAEFIGFEAKFNEGGFGGIGNIWAKPFGGDILTLKVGMYELDTLRGKVDTDTGFENFVLNGNHGPDLIFNRFGNEWQTKAVLYSEPMEGLFIGLQIPGQAERDLNDAFRHLQIGFGYQIPDIGHFRAQFIGGWLGSVDATQLAKDSVKGKYDPYNTNAVAAATAALTTAEAAFQSTPTATTATALAKAQDDLAAAKAKAIDPLSDPARIEVAFALTAVDNLLVDLGFKFWLPVELKDSKKKSDGVVVGLGARYGVDAFGVTATIKATFGAYDRAWEDDKSEKGLGFEINVIPTYAISDDVQIGASIGFIATGNGKLANGDAQEKAETSQFGLGGFVRKGLGNGYIKAGLAYKAAPTKTVGNDTGATGRGEFSIPIILEYWF